MPVEAVGLSKHYGGVTALSDVDFELAPGEVHAVVGENGAGKSTLVKILSGVVRPDSGAISIDGTPVTFGSARDALTRGVALVAQELAVFPDLSVIENLFPLAPIRRGPLLSPRRMAALAAPVLDELGLHVPLGARAGTLPLADQQLLEIGRALLRRPAVLILDEPTSALQREAVDRLMSVLRRLVSRGVAVLYVSHFLEEVLRIATRVTVLRDGRVAMAGVSTSTVDLDGVVTAMLGSRTIERRPVTQRHTAGTAIAVKGLSVPGQLTDVSFTVAAGEIVGLAGLQDAGHLAVLAALSGRATPTGHVRINGASAPRSPRAAVRAGIAFVPSDRKRYGLMLDKPVWQNTSAVSWLGIGRATWWLRQQQLIDTAWQYGTRLSIRGAPTDLTGTLSGGNQQKVVMAKWLAAEPTVILLDDPTRGVDISARAEMHAVIAELAAAGKPVLLASTDLAELCELCDRVLVFQRGRLVSELPHTELSEQALSVAMNAGFGQR
ncbi:sugar ABC transporter ATP-binding protein [Actinocrispum wychmicini]|uniref:Ribose transport system ATP-binding protein/rhamnose transport system ATP-binding protein n=1 Tax=Actinocrispum wychmicini TaxID=1213861 RepID=A0A4R2J877_9PSEU|nr:sugar ABC transporter ATP-binding protein [Actinocrispum wychmicini]TCO54814.1 ribose transport system ATP-binding protein/rhamnose transport system ATP-binding protein [Actinocrispum wychmicini]